MFEGTPQQFWTALSGLRSLPDDMRVYCAYESTQSNARFAVAVETDSVQLVARRASVDAARGEGRRRDRQGPCLVFAEVRHRRDVFR